MTKKALVVGISGQDGAYLADLLLSKGYEVHGTSRDCEVNSFSALESLGIRDRVKLHSMALRDFRSVRFVVDRLVPDEVYNLSGQSSVGLSFNQPVETFESIAVGTSQFARRPPVASNFCSNFQLRVERMFRQYGVSRRRKCAVSSAQPLRDGQSRSPLGNRQLSRSLWDVRLFLDLCESRKPVTTGTVCHTEDCASGGPYRRRGRQAKSWKSRHPAGLGLGPGLCRMFLADVTDGCTG